MAFTPDVPGRGSWTTKGGLLPPISKPTSKSGYYRAAQTDETPIGSLVVQGKATSDSSVSVWQGAKVLQVRLNAHMRTKLVVDGWIGPKTDEVIKSFQRGAGLTADGLVGPGTMRELLVDLVVSIAAVHKVPVGILGGLAAHESELCPAAVGSNGYDHGLLAINLEAHAEDITWTQAMDPVWSLNWAARELQETHDQWVGKTKADPWDIAIANHNSPRAARQWALAGKPVPDPGRLFPIQDYVSKVKEAW